jgi:uncharacterized protein YdaU (DUF1376 family)
MSDLEKPKRRVKPLWMPLYVAEFIADTTNLTASQGWAYINLLCAMWRTQDGTLPNDADTLARVGRVHRPRWEKVWNAIKSMFDVDGDRVTSTALQAELGKANALIVTRRAAAHIGGLTTQFRRASMNAIHRSPMTAPKPLKINDGAQANASLLLKQTTTTKVNKKKEEREDATRPGTVASPLEEASSEVPSETPQPCPNHPSHLKALSLTLRWRGRFRIGVRT